MRRAVRGTVRGTALALVAVLACAATGRSEEACELERWRTGLAVAAAEAGLVVTAVDDGSAGATAGVRAGDAVAQVNGIVPRTCADWARAVREARRERKAVLVLARRSAGDVPLVVAAAAWDRSPPPAPTAVPAAPAAEPPTVRELVAAAPPSIPAGTQVSVDEVLHDLASLGSEDRRLPTYRTELARLHGAVRALRARRTVPDAVVTGLETVLRYHDAAAVAWGAEESARERERRSRRLPSPEGMPAPFFADSDEAATIDAFPFLRDTVVREPAAGFVGESAGLWRPVQARTLLWERARAEQDRFAAWLGMARR